MRSASPAPRAPASRRVADAPGPIAADSGIGSSVGVEGAIVLAAAHATAAPGHHAGSPRRVANHGASRASHHSSRIHHSPSHHSSRIHHGGSHHSSRIHHSPSHHSSRIHHSASFGHGFGHGGHASYSVGLHFGSYGHGAHGYYRPYSHHGSYVTYGYGYGYSPLHHGYYSGYHRYAPDASYASAGPYYDDSYSPNGVYYYPAASRDAPISEPAREYDPIPDYAGVAHADAWSVLAHGNDRSAFRAFSRAAAGAPEDGAPKVGYALAAALLGDHARAAWAMRRALTTDPYSLSALRFDERLLARIDRLAEHYADAADDRRDHNADFMLAALSFLIGDHDLARIAIDAAIDHGDTSDASHVLRDMIPDADDLDL